MRIKEGNKEKDIIEAAIKIFATEGYHSTKISDIAKEAGIATGSVYLYFNSKEAIIFKIFEDLWQKIYSELETLSKSTFYSAIEKIEAMIDLIFDVFAGNPHLAIVFVNEQNFFLQKNEDRFSEYYNRFLDLGVNALIEGQGRNEIPSEINPDIFRFYIFGAIRNLIHQWAKNPDKYPLHKIRHIVKYLIKYGIATR